MPRSKRLKAFLVFLLLAAGLADRALAQEACEPVVGSLASLEGLVEVERAGTFVWQPAQLDQVLCEADSVRVGPRSRAAVRLINDAVLRLDQNTTLQLTDIKTEPEQRSFLALLTGVLQSFSRKPRLLAINTPYLNATIEGTEFAIAATEGQSSITVFEGIVTAANEQGEVRLARGEAAVAAAGQAPEKRIVVRPRDAVQWALYYPPILAAVGGQADAADLPPALAEATRRANAGDLEGAFATLDAVPERERDAEYQVYRAALLLSVGRVDEAQSAIDQALVRDPNSGLAYAQRAIVELVQNRKEEALVTAQRAVELSPDATAPKIALSYAQQANFELEPARDTLSQAVAQQPKDALARARLSELWLMLGDRKRARQETERAVALAPKVERTQITRGFADLVEFRTGPAKQAFERAIQLAPGDPLARLGLGLAQIRDGDLERGRRNLEVAVGLDANDALLRAYLGKAYFEEVRDDLANQQFHIAQELDPLDPTAFLYEGIKQQTENRPGEALQNLQKSTELNDNRAVYRSRLLLDSDRAARGTSLARVYNDLGFQDVAVQEASKSLTLDPAAAAAHRFLSDSYQAVRRREIARVSELLQAQMLQDININPIQPSLAETNLNLVTHGGPAEAGFNEFTPLFERNQFQFNSTGLAGTDDTFGGEGVASVLYGRYSASVGAFGYTTDGWRDNGDIRHDIEDVFFQAAITPDLNTQVEFTRRHSEHGDIALNFDPDDFLRDSERNLDQDAIRAGLRYSPLPGSDLLFSAIYSDRDEKADEQRPGPLDVSSKVHDKSYQIEGQYIHTRDFYNAVAGFGFSSVDSKQDTEFAFPGISFGQSINTTVTQPRGYLYTDTNLPQPVTWTFGFSYDSYEEEALEEQSFNPKIGVQWQITPDLLLRGAIFKVVKPALVNNRTIEPTQVAGFNQLFDDINATKSWRYGIGLDWQALKTLFVGAEGTWRELDEPVFVDSDVEFEKRHEQLHRAYLYWTPRSELALSTEFSYDRYTSEDGIATEFDNLPEKVETFSVPITLRYFHPSGVFAGFGVSYVNQKVERSPTSTLADGSSDFVVVDLSAGYRFPKRLGVASVQVSNLFDNGFKYQDDSFREFRDEPSTGPYIPARQIVGRITLNF